MSENLSKYDNYIEERFNEIIKEQVHKILKEDIEKNNKEEKELIDKIINLLPQEYHRQVWNLLDELLSIKNYTSYINEILIYKYGIRDGIEMKNFWTNL